LLIESTYINNLNKECKELVAFNDPLDTDLEFDNIFDAIKNNTKRKFVIRKEVATFDNLSLVMTCKPKMIHISCHGDCTFDKKTKRNTYFLAFEDTK